MVWRSSLEHGLTGLEWPDLMTCRCPEAFGNLGKNIPRGQRANHLVLVT